MKVGFIGLGNMGAAVARNIQRAGFEVAVRDLDRGRAATLEQNGAQWAESPAEVAAQCDVVVTMVFGPEQLTEVLRGADGLLCGGGMRGKVWVDMTTSSPSLARELAAETRAQGGDAVDAPVTGSVDAAIRGDMILFIGGGDDATARVWPVLRAAGEPRRVGEVGAGHVAKLTNNLMWKITAAAIGEALTAAKKSGLDPDKWREAMLGGAADSFVLRHDLPSIFAGHYDPSFPLALCMKDWRLIGDLLEETGARCEIADAARARFAEAEGRFGGGAGEMTVCKVLEEDSGASLQVPGDWPAPWEARHRDDVK